MEGDEEDEDEEEGTDVSTRGARGGGTGVRQDDEEV